MFNVVYCKLELIYLAKFDKGTDRLLTKLCIRKEKFKEVHSPTIQRETGEPLSLGW